MHQGRGGMGMSKHRLSGWATKSPRMRLSERMWAEAQVVTRRRRAPLRYASVIDAVRSQRCH